MESKTPEECRRCIHGEVCRYVHVEKPEPCVFRDLGTVEELAALKERTRWIPCSERLPNMCGFKCLVCAKNKFEQIHVFTAFTGYMEHGKLEFHSCEPPYDDLSAWEITHWMLLPEAPKEANHAK